MRNKLIAQSIRKTKTIPFIALFILVLFSPLYPSNTQCEWTGVQKIVAVGDLHGDYDSFKEILIGTGLIDKDDLHWTGGKTHLVQIGDVMDRGDYAKEILELLMRLETEAEQAGGKVHFLLGNHEEMNITGIALENKDYVTLKQFKDFLPESYKEKEETTFKEDYEKLSKIRKPELTLEQTINNHWETERGKAIADQKYRASEKYISNFNEKYGKWLVQHNVVIKIDDIIFAHGGINEKFSSWKLEDINDRARLELNSYIKGPRMNSEDLQVVYQPNGPLWYRRLSLPRPNEGYLYLKPVVDTILKNLGARYMVVAHTPLLIRTKADMTRFGGRIWIIDTGISYVYRQGGGRETALIIEETGTDIKFSVWPLDFNQESKQLIEQTRYLQEGMATKAFELPEFIDYILRDELRMRIFYRGEQ